MATQERLLPWREARKYLFEKNIGLTLQLFDSSGKVRTLGALHLSQAGYPLPQLNDGAFKFECEVHAVVYSVLVDWARKGLELSFNDACYGESATNDCAANRHADQCVGGRPFLAQLVPCSERS